jgi:uncharacterized protein DUF4382
MAVTKRICMILLLAMLPLLYLGCADTSDESANSGIVVGTGDTGGSESGPGTLVPPPEEVLGDGKANLAMSLMDAPIDDADSVKVTIKKIDFKMGVCGEPSETCDATGDQCEFVTFFDATSDAEEQTVNLLDYQNGNSFVFITQSLDVGEYCQFRMYLNGDPGKNTITLTGETDPIDLELNAGIQNNGLKLVSGFELIDGQETSLAIDFDVRKSIVAKGNSSSRRYALKPTIRIVQTSQSDTVLSGNITLTEPVVVAAGEAFYLYEDGFGVAGQEFTQETDDMGTDDLADDELVDSSYANAVSSVTSDVNKTAVFVAVPFGTYDIYRVDADSSTDALELVQGGVVVAAP